jgi:hypothetical protein
MAGVLHWLGKYNESNALTLLSRLLRAKKIEQLDELERFVANKESATPTGPAAGREGEGTEG